MDQRNKWQQILDDLNAIEIRKTDTALVREYRNAIKDIKVQAKGFIDEYDKLSFSKRLEAERLLNIGQEIQGILEGTNRAVTQTIAEGTGNMAKNGYYSTFYGLEGEYGLNVPMSFLDEDYIKSVVNSPVDGKTLSQRLYKNTNQLARATTQSLIQGTIDGKGYKYVAKRIEDLAASDYKKALRIARTEGGRASSLSQQTAYEEAKNVGVNMKKRWLATLDEITRNSHRLLDGQTVETDDNFISPETGAIGKGPRLMGSAGEDINCRCTTIAVVNDYAPELRRDNQTGEMVKNMSYTEWQSYKGVPVSTPKARAAAAFDFKEFKTVRETVDYGVDNSQQWQKSLTKEEFEAMDRYTIISNDINGYARDGDDYFNRFATPPNKQAEIKQQLKAVESAIEKSTLKDDLVLYRGTNAKALNLATNQLNDDTLNSLIGKTITEKGFLSTTGMKDVAEIYGNDVILRINAPKGIKGAFVDAIQDISTFEDGDFNLEFLLQRNQSMEITGFKKATTKYGKQYYEVFVDVLKKRK